jgi:hypothetical protein
MRRSAKDVLRGDVGSSGEWLPVRRVGPVSHVLRRVGIPTLTKNWRTEFQAGIEYSPCCFSVRFFRASESQECDEDRSEEQGDRGVVRDG